ncbi:MAG: DUF6596 domain-containing protein [Pseudomonadota bacterium]
MKQPANTAVEIANVRPRVLAALAAHLRDLDAAEDAFAEASASCIALDDPPENIAAWLLTVAKRKAIDAIRRNQAEARAAQGAAMVSDMAEIIQLPEAIPDERLRLIFICCHPSLAPEARAALAMKVICGLPVSAIARVFVTSEATMYQRIVRAKSKVREAKIDFDLPPRRLWGERLDAVLLTLELAYTVAYQDAGGELDSELSGEIARLAQMVAELLPEEPEALGLAALVALARSREAARIDEEGAMVPLSQQDITLWDNAMIDQARQWLDQAASFGRTGPYQIMAAIQLTHARRAFDGATDWQSILKLYDALLIIRPGAMIALNRAVASAQVEGPEAALKLLDALPSERLESARPYHAARAEILTQAGDREGARASLKAALVLDPPQAERMHLERKLSAL